MRSKKKRSRRRTEMKRRLRTDGRWEVRRDGGGTKLRKDGRSRKEGRKLELELER